MRSLFLLLFFSVQAALAQPYPAKPLRWIVPTGPGAKWGKVIKQAGIKIQ